MLCGVDLPSEESDPRAMFFCGVQEFEGVMCGSCRSPEYANHQRWIVGANLFHGGGTVVWNFQELRSRNRGDTSEQSNNMIVQE